MKTPDNKMVDLAKAFRTSGFLLPADESEIEAFEKNLEKDSNKPIDWDNPLKIISRGKIKKVEFKKHSLDENAVENLSMAAREGKEISEIVRKKMNEDRKNSK